MGNTDSRYNQVNYINHYYSCIVKDKCSTCDALWEEYIENCDREPERRTRNENHRTHQRNYINHYLLCKEKTCSTCDTLWSFYIDSAIEQEAATSLHRKNYTSHYFSCKESGCLACDSLCNIYIEGAPTNVRTINEIFHKRK